MTTWKQSGAVWWGIWWRTAIIAELPSFFRGLYTGFNHVSVTPYDWQINALSWILSIIAGIWAIRRILNKGISGYTLTLTQK